MQQSITVVQIISLLSCSSIGLECDLCLQLFEYYIVMLNMLYDWHMSHIFKKIKKKNKYKICGNAIVYHIISLYK